MRARLRWLRVVSFVAVGLGLLLGSEVGQAVAESFLSPEETQMARLVNRHRDNRHDRRTLDMNSALRMLARRQTQRMVTAGFIYHNPDLVKEANKALPDWIKLGENVGVGPDVPSVEKAFLASSGHHANIHLGAYNLIGVGAMAGDQGSKFYTQTFAQVDSSSAFAAGPGFAIATAQAGPAAEAQVLYLETPGVPAPADLSDGESGVTLWRGLAGMLGRSVSNIGRGLGRLAFWR